ncbi:MAG: hypothetical protein GX455_08650 [Phycisphaerae bacterium]|nr:hypothetical protein [Phycisphaerae bacterium]
MPELFALLASFTRPIEIGTTPTSILWMFPLLASISIVYKATKMRVLFWDRFLREVVVLLLTVSLFMIITAVALNIIVWWFT